MREGGHATRNEQGDISLNDLRVARGNLRQHRGRIVSFTAVVVLGSIFSLLCIGTVDRAASGAQHASQEGAAPRTIELDNQPERTDLKPLRGNNVARLQSIGHVATVSPWLQASFGIKTPQIGGALLYAMPWGATTPPPLVRSLRPQLAALSKGEVILPASAQGEDLTPLLGQSLHVTFTRKTGEGTGEGANVDVLVAGLYDPKYQADGPSVAYANLDFVTKLAAARAGVTASKFPNTIGYHKVFVLVDSSRAVGGVVTELRSQGYSATSLSAKLSSLPPGLQALRILGMVVLVFLALYVGLAGVTISISFMKSRKREIGLPNSPRRMMRILILELLIVGGAAGAAGALLGVVASGVATVVLGGGDFLGATMPTGVAIPGMLWIALVFLAPPVTIVCGGMIPALRVARLKSAGALRTT